ncbi:MAG: hypothetical protein EOQ33_21870 [Mesorhizobium sp.]|nr:MAG: hypothetical protein EOQ33_21870 [Mesorhizobium sp.]
MVRLLVEEARNALPLPNYPQCERDVRFVISTSPHAPIPRSGFVLRPQSCQSAARIFSQWRRRNATKTHRQSGMPSSI